MDYAALITLWARHLPGPARYNSYSRADLQEAGGLLEHSALVCGQVSGGDAGAREVGLQQRVDLGVGIRPLGRVDSQRGMQQQLTHLLVLACSKGRCMSGHMVQFHCTQESHLKQTSFCALVALRTGFGIIEHTVETCTPATHVRMKA